jgi:cytoskeletal protein CcmA (bactofilin family)
MRWLLSASVAGVLVCGLPAAVSAAELRTGDTVVVSAPEVVHDDVYAFGNNVTIQGTVDGDLIAAGNSVTVTGHVTGDVMAAGNTVIVSGPVDGSVRVGANLLTLAAPVGEDALIGGSMLNLTGAGSVGRDVIAGGSSVAIQGPIAGDVNAGAGKLVVSSAIGGALRGEINDLVLENGAVVRGPVTFVGGSDATIAPGARIEGSIQRTPPASAAARPWEVGGFDLLGLARGFVGLAVFGVLLALAFPRATTTVGETVQRSWLGSLGLGFALLVGIPMLALLVFIIGLMIGGWWIGLTLLGIYALLAVIGYLAAAEWIGLAAARLANWHVHPAWTLLLGLVVLGVLTLLPVLGWFIGLVAMLVGLGAVALAAWHAYHGAPTAPVATGTAPVVTPLPQAA